MKTGDVVRVYPHGSPELAAPAKIIVVGNDASIAVAFGDKPPFVTAGHGLAVHPMFGVVMLARREMLNGRPWGPWIELIGGGHYEMEEL